MTKRKSQRRPDLAKWGAAQIQNADIGVGRPSQGADAPTRGIYTALGIDVPADRAWKPDRYAQDVFNSLMTAKLFARYRITPYPELFAAADVPSLRKRRYSRILRVMKPRFGASAEDVRELASQRELESFSRLATWFHNRCARQLQAFADDSTARLWWAESWTPSADDWRRLALAQATHHHEPGFVLEVEANTKAGARRLRDAEKVHERDELMSQLIREGKTTERAALEVARKLGGKATAIKAAYNSGGNRRLVDAVERAREAGHSSAESVARVVASINGGPETATEVKAAYREREPKIVKAVNRLTRNSLPIRLAIEKAAAALCVSTSVVRAKRKAGDRQVIDALRMAKNPPALDEACEIVAANLRKSAVKASDVIEAYAAAGKGEGLSPLIRLWLRANSRAADLENAVQEGVFVPAGPFRAGGLRMPPARTK